MKAGENKNDSNRPKVDDTNASRSILIDVRRPDFNYDHLTHYNTINLRKESEVVSKAHSLLGRIVELTLIGILVLTTSMLIFTGQRFYDRKTSLKHEAARVAVSFSSTTEALENAQYGLAVDNTKLNSARITTLRDVYQSASGPTLTNILSLFVPAIRETGQLIKEAASLNSHLYEYSEAQDILQKNVVRYLFTDGSSFITQTAKIGELARILLDEYASVRNRAQTIRAMTQNNAEINNFLDDTYLKQAADLTAWNSFFQILGNKATATSGINIALAYYNESVPRPGGGLLQAVSIMNFRNGQLSTSTHLRASDIILPPSFSKAPSELLSRGSYWQTEDLLWFDDAAVSARTLESLLEISSTTPPGFDGLDLTVLLSSADLRRIIELASGTLSATSTPPLSFARYEAALKPVPQKKGVIAGSILRDFMSQLLVIFTKPETNHSILTVLVREGIDRGSIVLTSRYPEVQNLFSDHGSKNASFIPEVNFPGIYLAPRISDIDKLPAPRIPRLEFFGSAHIDPNGSFLMDTTLTVKDTRSNNTMKIPYVVDFFTNPRTELISLKNNVQLRAPQKRTEGLALELLTEEKNRLFLSNHGVWMEDFLNKTRFKIHTLDLQSSPLELRTLKHENQRTSLATGDTFEFIFDPQRGIPAKIDMRIHAPVGFHFTETGSPVYFVRAETIKEPVRASMTLAR